MKLSEMTTTQLTDCLCLIAEPIGNIAADAEVTDAIKRYQDKDMTLIDQIGLLTGKLLPLALKKHRADVFAVLAALTGKTVKQIGAQNGLELVREARDCLDNDIIAFFKSAGATEQDA